MVGALPQTTSSSGIVSKHSAYEFITATVNHVIHEFSPRYYVTSASSPIASSAREQNSSVYDPIISTPSAYEYITPSLNSVYCLLPLRNPASSTSSPPSRSESPGSTSNRHHQLSIIIGATIVSLVFILLLLGIGIYFFSHGNAYHTMDNQ